jgi:hypothetical protein
VPHLVDYELLEAATHEFAKTGVELSVLLAGIGVSQLTSALFHALRSSERKTMMFLPTYGLHLLYSNFANADVFAFPATKQGTLSIDADTISAGLKACPETDVTGALPQGARGGRECTEYPLGGQSYHRSETPPAPRIKAVGKVRDW